MEESVYSQYYRLERDHWWFEGMRTTCEEELNRLLRDGKCEDGWCVDVGCGTGLWTQRLGPFGRVVGLDRSPKALSYCKKRGLTRLIRSRGEELPFRNNTFDVVTALGVIEHLDNDDFFLSEVFRVCKSQGHVLILTSAYQRLWSRHDEIVHHKRRYSRKQLCNLLSQAHFDVARVSHVNAFLLPGILLVRVLRKILGAEFNESRSGTPDFFLPPKWMNQLLFKVLKVESGMLKYLNLPFGLGLLASARKSV